MARQQRNSKFRDVVAGAAEEPKMPRLGSPIVTFLGDCPRKLVGSVPVPGEFEEVAAAFADARLARLEDAFLDPAGYFTERDGGCDAYRQEMELRCGTSQIESHEIGLEITRDSIKEAFRAGYYVAMLRYNTPLAHFADAIELLQQQSENGKILSEEGRYRKASLDVERSKVVCELWRVVRPSFPLGRKGNGEALRVVADRYFTKTAETLTTRSVRRILNRAKALEPK
jgi:hypothetical protein